VKTRIPVHSPLGRASRIITAEGSRAKQEVWMTSRDYQIFELGDVPLQSGLTLRNALVAYKTYGRFDGARSNVIVYPTSYGAQHYDTEWLIRPGRALDPERYSSSFRICSGMACLPRRAMSVRRTIAAASLA
jgi:homoserine acetyltransferase